jgi:hypothetical protein
MEAIMPSPANSGAAKTHQDATTPLLETRRPSVQLRNIVDTYMVSQSSGLDGSIHKALNTNDPRVKLNPDRHKWVETELEEVNLYAKLLLTYQRSY